jgi:hypothetical protein
LLQKGELLNTILLKESVKVRLGDGNIEEAKYKVELGLVIERELYTIEANILPELPYALISQENLFLFLPPA